MREILFKAKKEYGGEWVEGFYVRRDIYLTKQDNSVEVRQFHRIYNNENGWQKYSAVDPETVCQYTGLTDKNGVKIFEGDRIRFVTWEKDVMERAVCWDHEHGRFCVWLNGAVTIGVNRYLSEDIEVIGNIHDKEG